MRADTMAAPVNAARPTEAAVLVRAIALIVTLVARIHGAGAARSATTPSLGHPTVKIATHRCRHVAPALPGASTAAASPA